MIITLADLPLNWRQHAPLLADIWRVRSTRTAYAALAEALGVPLITRDARMARTPAAVPIEVF